MIIGLNAGHTLSGSGTGAIGFINEGVENRVLYKLVEKLTPDCFKRVKNNSKVMCANVDMYSGFVYKMLGIAPELYTPIFAISRIAGWCAHRLEETIGCSRIIRPAYKSIAEKRKYVPIEER